MTARAARAAALAAGGLLAVPACGDGASPPLPGSAARVLFAGCWSVRPGPTCVLDEGRALTLWWPGGDGALGVLRVDGQPVRPSAVGPRSDGTTCRLTLPPGARLLELETDAVPPRRFRIAIAHAPRPDEELVRARRLRAGGQREEARELLRRSSPASPAARLARDALMARLSLTEDFDAAVAALTRTMAEYEALGEPTKAVEEAIPLSHALLTRKHDLGAAAAVLTRARRLAEGAPEPLAAVRYNEGGVAAQLGDQRAALRAFEEAYDLSRKLDLESDARFARRQIALTLKHLGREREALIVQRELARGPFADSCEEADALVFVALNLGSIQEKYGAEERRRQPPEDPAALLARAEAPVAACRDPGRVRNLVVERLLRALTDGDLAGARALHARLAAMAPASHDLPAVLVWQAEAEGRFALAEGQWRRARAKFQLQRAQAERLDLREEQFRAAVALAEVAERLGQRPAALAESARAEQLLERMVARVPPGLGAFGFSRSHVASARRLVETLLRLARTDEAFAVARLANARARRQAAHFTRVATVSGAARAEWEAALERYRRLRAEAEAVVARWDLPADERRAAEERRQRWARESEAALEAAHLAIGEGAAPAMLRAPRAGEVLLACFRLADCWVGFAATRARLRAVSLRVGLDDVGPSLLAAFARELAVATKVVFLVPDDVARLDIHALAPGTGPLVAQVPVSYGLDLRSSSASLPAASTGGPRALLVADPTLDLSNARAEIAAARPALEAAGFVVESLIGAEATHRRVVERLPPAEYFHFGGHGRQDGLEGFTSELPLAGGTRLRLGDILSLSRAPAGVLLSACEGAEVPPEGGMAIGHAFLAAGSSWVIAAARRVTSDEAAPLAAALYRHGITARGADPAAILRAAQLELARGGQPRAWSAFRVLEP